MLESCNRLNDDLQAAIILAIEEASCEGSKRVGTEHLLLGLAGQQGSLAASALAAIRIDLPGLKKEVEKLLGNKEFVSCESDINVFPGNICIFRLYSRFKKDGKEIPFSDPLIMAIARADNFSRYLGQDEIDTSHILLALLDMKHTCAARILEELSVNLNFFKGKIMHLMASAYLHAKQPSNLRSALISALKQLVEKHESALYVVQELVQRSKVSIIESPKKDKILSTVCIAYLAECLNVQVAFQRYLLEEALLTLSQTAGAIDQEISGQIISMTAQYLRQQAREGIEYVWTDEYRLLKHMLSDAEHDLIGSVIEDLWWAYSEDIALDQSFGSALADHRRTHLLDLQKKRVELSQRLHRVQMRLVETVRHCFSAQAIG